MKATMRAICGVGALLAVMAPGLAAAEEEGKKETTVGVSVDASILLGYGLSVGTGLGDRFNVRGAYHFLNYERKEEGDQGDPDYEAELALKTTALLFDWHPFRGTFRLTGGLMKNGNQINLVATDDGTGEYEFGDCTFASDPVDPLRVNGKVDFKGTAPYFGLGWGGNMNAEPGFYGTFDLGVMFSGAPTAKLKGRGSARNTDPIGQPECGNGTSQDVSNYPEFQDAMNDAEDEANDEAKDFKLWPNIAFGLGWRF